jgi:hypothetical protein
MCEKRFESVKNISRTTSQVYIDLKVRELIYPRRVGW